MMKLEIDLTDENYFYQDLATSEARRFALAGHVLDTLLQSDNWKESALLVELTSYDNDDGVPSPYMIQAQMWAGEFGSRLRMVHGDTVLDELENCERIDRDLHRVNSLHVGHAGEGEAFTQFVTPQQVIGGVRSLLTDPALNHVADRRGVSWVTVDLDPDQLVRGSSGVRDVRTPDEGPPSTPSAKGPPRRSDPPRHAADSMPARRHL